MVFTLEPIIEICTVYTTVAQHINFAKRDLKVLGIASSFFPAILAFFFFFFY